MNANRLLIFAMALGLLVGCFKKAESVQSVGTGISVETLFTKDGCTVYRFYDGGFRYFTNCRGNTAWREGCGKNCSRETGITGGQQ